jgi:tetratricopeptide (TPR) repeat protein
MFAQWRITLRQAEEAARGGRLEEALELIDQAGAGDRYEIAAFRTRVLDQLVVRAREQVKLGHTQAAWRDVATVERAGVAGNGIDKVRAELLRRAVSELDAYLSSGDPAAALQLVEHLRRRRAESAELRCRGEVAQLWDRARQLARTGEFTSALDLIDVAIRLLPGQGELAREKRSLAERQSRVAEHRNELQEAVQGRDWSRAVRVADAILDLAPGASDVLRARDAAWRELGVAVTKVPVVEPAQRNADRGRADGIARAGRRCVLWIDRVGGFWICLDASVSLGQAAPENVVDVPILGDLSRQHAQLRRDGEGYVLRSDKDISVNGRAEREVALRDGDQIRLGRNVGLRFAQPSPVSLTARIEFLTPHRLPLSVRAILLMDQTCVIGDSPQAHIQAPGLASPIVIYRQGDELWCQCNGEIQIDDKLHTGRAPLPVGARAQAGDFSFSLEAVTTSSSDV